MTPDDKFRAYEQSIMKAAVDVQYANHRAETLQVENMALRATLRRVCAWLYDEKLYRKLPTEIEEEILVALEMTASEVSE